MEKLTKGILSQNVDFTFNWENDKRAMRFVIDRYLSYNSHFSDIIKSNISLVNKFKQNGDEKKDFQDYLNFLSEKYVYRNWIVFTPKKAVNFANEKILYSANLI